MVKLIPRSIKHDLKDALINSNKVVIVLGPRQVGKTTLINNILNNIELNSTKLNGEEQLVKDAFSSLSYQRMMESVGNRDILFIDEAQNILEIGMNIKILHDQNPNLRIIISGSSSLELANRLQEPLTGRKRVFHLFPLSIDELLDDGYTPLQIREHLSTILKYGLYPEVVMQKNIADKEIVLRELSTSYLYKDILQLADIRHSNKIHDLLRLLALQIGSTVSINKLSNALNLSALTIEHYINLLEQSFVVFRLRGFSKNLSKEISKMDKIYFYDTGVRNTILNNFNNLELRQDTGSLWENFLISERLKANSYSRAYKNIYFWRTYTGAEIDYIEEKDGHMDAFELKYNNKVSKVPKTWKDNYPQATYTTINLDNFFEYTNISIGKKDKTLSD